MRIELKYQKKEKETEIHAWQTKKAKAKAQSMLFKREENTFIGRQEMMGVGFQRGPSFSQAAKGTHLGTLGLLALDRRRRLLLLRSIVRRCYRCCCCRQHLGECLAHIYALYYVLGLGWLLLVGLI